MKRITLTILLMFVLKSAVAQICENDANCGEDQCCVSTIFLYKTYNQCRNRLAEGQLCIPEVNSLKRSNGNYLSRCPCKTGLTCGTNRYLELPFYGKVGVNEHCMSQNSDTSTNEGSDSKIPTVA